MFDRSISSTDFERFKGQRQNQSVKKSHGRERSVRAPTQLIQLQSLLTHWRNMKNEYLSSFRIFFFTNSSNKANTVRFLLTFFNTPNSRSQLSSFKFFIPFHSIRKIMRNSRNDMKMDMRNRLSLLNVNGTTPRVHFHPTPDQTHVMQMYWDSFRQVWFQFHHMKKKRERNVKWWMNMSTWRTESGPSWTMRSYEVQFSYADIITWVQSWRKSKNSRRTSAESFPISERRSACCDGITFYISYIQRE